MYGVGIVKGHPLIDGNKRVALMVMYVLLETNGYLLDASEVEAVDVMLRLARLISKRDFGFPPESLFRENGPTG